MSERFTFEQRRELSRLVLEVSETAREYGALMSSDSETDYQEAKAAEKAAFKAFLDYLYGEDES